MEHWSYTTEFIFSILSFCIPYRVFDLYSETVYFLALQTVIYLTGFIACYITMPAGKSCEFKGVELIKDIAGVSVLSILLGGSPIEIATYLIASKIFIYISLPYRLLSRFNIAEKITICGFMLALVNYPLDWDYEVPWQVYPFPFLLLGDIAHTLGLAYEIAHSLVNKKKIK